MAYTATTWTQNVTPANATNMNHLETQYAEASSSFEQELFTAFVFSGLVATKDGVTANKLDVTSGIAFLTQSDSTLRRRAPVASSQTTSTPSTTYYLFLNNDGTWTWGTTSTGPTNSLAVAQVTTDVSGNISTVTDKRTLNTTLMNGMAGSLSMPGGGVLLGSAVTGTAGTLPISSQQSGAANGIQFNTWTGTAQAVPFSVGGQFGGATSWIASNGDATFGATVQIGTAVGGTFANARYASVNNALQFMSPQSGASALGHLFVTWNGSAQKIPFSVGGQFAGALAWIDNTGGLTASGLATLNGGITTTSITASGLATLNGGITTTSITASGLATLNGNLSISASVTGTTSIAPTGGLALRNNNGVGNFAITMFSGTGNGTFSHGVTTTPNSVQATCSLSGSSQTMGAGGFTSTTVVITTGSGLAWTAVAFK